MRRFLECAHCNVPTVNRCVSCGNVAYCDALCAFQDDINHAQACLRAQRIAAQLIRPPVAVVYNWRVPRRRRRRHDVL
jgi:hypothetical protein